MARTVKLLKYPKKPKTTASIAVKERFLAKCKEIDKENARRIAEKRKSEMLDKKISGIVSSRVSHPSKFSTVVTQKYSRKKAVPKKKRTTKVSGVSRRKTRTGRTRARR